MMYDQNLHQNIKRLASWIEASKNKLAAHSRYRAAMKRPYVNNATAFATLAEARDRALARLAGKPTPAPRHATLCDDCGVPLVELAKTIPPGYVLMTSGVVVESAWPED